MPESGFWLECCTCVKWEKFSHWYFVRATLKAFWDCEIKGAIEMQCA